MLSLSSRSDFMFLRNLPSGPRAAKAINITSRGLNRVRGMGSLVRLALRVTMVPPFCGVRVMVWSSSIPFGMVEWNEKRSLGETSVTVTKSPVLPPWTHWYLAPTWTGPSATAEISMR